MEKTSGRQKELCKKALSLIEVEGWANFHLEKLAQISGVPLEEVHSFFPTKRDLFSVFFDLINGDFEEQMAQIHSLEEESVRDRLFDLIMTRFDCLSPYKRVLIRLWGGVGADPCLAIIHEKKAHSVLTQILHRAGISQESMSFILQLKALYIVYLWTLGAWILEEDPSMAGTMVALDKGLTQLEEWKLLPKES